MMKKGQLSFFLIALLFLMNMPPHIGLAETNVTNLVETNKSIQVEGIIGKQQVVVTDKENAGKSSIVTRKKPSQKVRHKMPELGSDTEQAQMFLMLGLLCLTGATFVYCTRKYQEKDGNHDTTNNATKKVEP